GDPAADACRTIVAIRTATLEVPNPVLGLGAHLLRPPFLRAFRSAAGLDLGPHWRGEIEARIADPAVYEAERARLRRWLARLPEGGGSGPDGLRPAGRRQ